MALVRELFGLAADEVGTERQPERSEAGQPEQLAEVREFRRP
jgi:hypothetical protein